MRVGIGHDTHRLEAGGPLRLGGVDIPHDRRLVGHSDGDVLLHAVIDALLGAAALGDIGELYPDTDPEHRGRDSGQMLQEVCQRLAGKGLRPVNVDCIVFAQRPHLGPYKQAIRQHLAQLLEIDPACVAVKAKTAEGLGPVGRQEAIMAQAVVLVESSP